MSRNQRLTFLGIAAAIAVVAVVILASAGGDEPSPTAAQPTPSATGTQGGSGTATPTPTPTPTPKPAVPVLAAGQVKKLRYTEGDTVRFRVRSDVPEEVHVHGYDLKADIEPGKPAQMSFKASITGIFEIELEHSGQQLAELRVDPK
jgi:FtsP/CotA-like multicopper oxidase with cupredoxin domain